MSGEIHPLTAVQREIWFEQALWGDVPMFNIGGHVRIDGRVDAERFERAVNLLVQKHDALRIVLIRGTDEDGVPQQAFAEAMTVRVPLRDLSGAVDPPSALRAWSQRLAATPFRLNGERLFRVELAKVDDTYFCFTLICHHLIVDGWAFGLLGDSLGRIYSALEANEEPDLEAPSYLDFIEQDRALQASPQYERQRSYWLDRYRSVPDPLFGPRRRERVDGLAAPSGYHTLRLPRAFYERIVALARDQKSTPFHLILAVLCVYFSRTAQRRDFAVGVPVLNRSTARMKRTVGMFASVSAVRLQFEGVLRFNDLLVAIGQTLRQDYRHQRFPVSELNRALGLRQSRRSQLFDISVSYERDDQDVRFGSSSTQGCRCSNGHEQLPLALHIRENRFDENAWVHFTYNLAYFEADEIEALGARFEHLLNQVLDDVLVPLASLALPAPAELKRLAEWNAGEATFPQGEPLHRLFEANVRAAPASIAVEHEGRRLTYAELNAQANRVAHRLIAQGVKPDDRVAICVERSLGMIVGLLGVLKAGAAYVPLDPTYPPRRLTYMLNDSAPVAVLVQRATRGVLGESSLPMIDLDAAADLPTHDPVVPGLGAQHLAYVIYTSGSTGRPKGVMIEHRHVARLFAATDAWFGFGRDDVWTLFHSFAFDFSVWEIWGALLHGGCLVVVPTSTCRSPQAFHTLLCDSGVTVLNQTPGAFGPLVAVQAESDRSHRLRHVVFGGEALDVGLLEPWYEDARNRDCRLVNMYGITETTVHVTYWPLTASGGDPACIGRPIPDLSTQVLDTDLNPMPIGVPGELCIGGAGLARGYLNRPALTAERFVCDPFGTRPGARLYRTGDLVRFLPDGRLEYLGRIDSQVKIRGFRIELGEIEAALSALPGVRQSLLVAGEPEPGEKRLVAYLVFDATHPEPDVAQLRTALSHTLPAFMLPSHIVALERFPLTAHGKIDRSGLPLPDAAASSRRGYEAPQGEAEELLAEVWSQLLGVAQVGRDDDFFALGGHSLLALKVVSRLRHRLSRDVPVGGLFKHPTLRAFAATFDDGSAAAPETPLVPRGLSNAPLSLPQERLWVLWRLDPESAAYNVSGALELEGAFDAQAARHAIDELVRRHAMLRTRFVEVGDVPRQLIDAPEQAAGAWRWDTLDLQHADRASLAAQLRLRAREPFDLEHGPLLRASLFGVAPQHHVLHFVMHHIVSDAESIDVLLREFSAFYRAARRGEAAALPALAVQYADYAEWQRLHFGRAGGAALEAQLAYWRQRLSGLPAAVDLPTEHDRRHPYPPRSARTGMRIPAPLAKGVEALARGEGATLFMVLLTALDVLLYRYSGATDLLVAVPVAGRDRFETEGLIGFFVNTLVMRARLSAAQPFSALLRQVRVDSMAAQTNRDLPFDRVVADLQQARLPSGNPLTQIKLMLHDAFDAALDLDGVRCRLLDVDESDTRFELALDIARGAQGLDCRVAYAAELYDDSFIGQFARHYVDVLAQAVETPHRTLGDFTLRDIEASDRRDEAAADTAPASIFNLS